MLTVSCVEEKATEENGRLFRVHPHKLLGEGCSFDGVCRVKVEPKNDMTYEFKNLKLQCVKRDDIIDVLTKRKISNVDPFNQGIEENIRYGSIEYKEM